MLQMTNISGSSIDNKIQYKVLQKYVKNFYTIAYNII